MTGSAEDFWESRFQADRTPWERGALNPAFLAWRASGEMTASRILIPGAGRSPEPAALLAAGFDVIALDLAESAVTDQAERLGRERAVRADVTTWMPDEPFDAVYDQTCLCAMPPKLWIAYEANLRAWLRPGGRLFVLFMQTGREGGPPFDCAIPAMRSLFSEWVWPTALQPGVEHSIGIEQPAMLIRPKPAWAPLPPRPHRE